MAVSICYLTPRIKHKRTLGWNKGTITAPLDALNKQNRALSLVGDAWWIWLIESLPGQIKFYKSPKLYLYTLYGTIRTPLRLFSLCPLFCHANPKIIQALPSTVSCIKNCFVQETVLYETPQTKSLTDQPWHILKSLSHFFHAAYVCILQVHPSWHSVMIPAYPLDTLSWFYTHHWPYDLYLCGYILFYG